MEYTIKGIRKEKILKIQPLEDGKIVLKIRNKKGEGDFRVVVYNPENLKKFTPKHAHFVIDLYGKLCRDKDLTLSLFKAVEKVYNGEDVGEVLKELENSSLKTQFEKLPGYNVDYILWCLSFIFEQEDVNFKRYLKVRGGKLPPLREDLLRRGMASEEEIYKGRFLSWFCLKRIVEEGVHPVEAMLEARLRI